jgi:hypothetical protein
MNALMGVALVGSLVACSLPVPAVIAPPVAAPPAIAKLTFAFSDPVVEAGVEPYTCQGWMAPQFLPALKSQLRSKLEQRLRATGVRVVAARTKETAVAVSVRVSANVQYGNIYCKPVTTSRFAMIGADEEILGEIVLDLPDQDVSAMEQSEAHLDLIAAEAVARLVGNPAIAALAEKQPATAATGALSLTRARTMLVLNLTGAGNVPVHVPSLVTSLLLSELAKVHNLTTVSSKDIDNMLSVERKKDLIGCTSASCLAEIGGALGAELVLYGELGQLGSRFSVNVTILNSRTGQAAGRVSVLVPANEDAIADETPQLAREIVAKIP